jgi:hypothetical protein
VCLLMTEGQYCFCLAGSVGGKHALASRCPQLRVDRIGACAWNLRLRETNSIDSKLLGVCKDAMELTPWTASDASTPAMLRD